MADFTGKNTSPKDWLITPEQLKQAIAKGENITLLDVREPEEIREGYIEGTKFIPMGDLSRRVGSEIDLKSNLVIYCAHGVRSMHALFGMMRTGFARIRSLDGGIVAWEEAGGKITRGGA